MRLQLDSAGVAHGGGVHALSEVSLVIAPGERVVLIGPSGAGKTTLLAVLGAALRPTTGAVRLDGADPWRLSSRALRALRARLFLAPQAPPLPPRQRVVTAVLAGRLPGMSLGAAVASLLRPSDPRAAHDALARFGLAHKLWARVDRLSGGERQRVSLARALMSDARVLLCDEPLSALDPALAGQALEALRDAAQDRGATLVCSLHQVGLALARFDRVIGLRDGRVLFDRAPDRIADADIERLYAGQRADAPAGGAGDGDASPDGRALSGHRTMPGNPARSGDPAPFSDPAPSGAPVGALPEAVEAAAAVAPLPPMRCL